MNLWEKAMPYADSEVDFTPTIEAYPAEGDGAVIIFPGGGYCNRAEHEGEPVAKMLNSYGITAFVVQYRVYPYSNPSPLSDAMRAVRYVRAHAKDYKINKDKIAVMGFSAGGHLAGSVSVHYDKDVYAPTDAVDNESARPNASILCYPVIDMLNYRHDGSKCNLLGARPKYADLEYMSLYKQITDDTPPAFLWHTSNDAVVPVENSLMYANALAAHNIQFELHVFPQGPHGMGLAEDDVQVCQWTKALDIWLENLGWKNK